MYMYADHGSICFLFIVTALAYEILIHGSEIAHAARKLTTVHVRAVCP
jgi:hypothetical protein